MYGCVVGGGVELSEKQNPFSYNITDLHVTNWLLNTIVKTVVNAPLENHLVLLNINGHGFVTYRVVQKKYTLFCLQISQKWVDISKLSY